MASILFFLRKDWKKLKQKSNDASCPVAFRWPLPTYLEMFCEMFNEGSGTRAIDN